MIYETGKTYKYMLNIHELGGRYISAVWMDGMFPNAPHAGCLDELPAEVQADPHGYRIVGEEWIKIEHDGTL